MCPMPHTKMQRVLSALRVVVKPHVQVSLQVPVALQVQVELLG